MTGSALIRHYGRMLAVLSALLTACLLCLPKAYAERLPDLINRVRPGDIFPGADRFGEPSGKPMTAKVFAGDKELGVVYITTDVVNTRGYSSKPIDTMVAIDSEGTIKGARLLAHSEPIVLIGIPQSKVDDFISKYVGLNPVKNPPKENETPADIVSGATVTVLVIGDSINKSVRAVYGAMHGGQTAAAADASAVSGSLKTRPHRLMNMEKQDVLSWKQLLDDKAVAELHLTVGDINKRFEETGNQAAAAKPEKGGADELFVNLYTAVVSQPSIGKSLLGEAGYKALADRLKPGQQAILVAGEGRYSFKGSGYVRGGIFDRIEVIQGTNTIRFTDAHHDRLVSLAAQGAPDFKEISLFVTPEDAVFDPAEPWRLQLMVQREVSVQNKAFIAADLHYEMPPAFVVDDPKGEPVAVESAAAAVGDGAADAAADQPAKQQLWKQIWQSKMGHVLALMAMLVVLIAVFFFQDTLVKYPVFYTRFRIAYLTVTLFYVGWYLHAQLSVVNVLTFASALLHGFSWDFFLMDPFVFTLWCATAIAMLFWGRGAFCGWLCPFGSLQELTNLIAKKLGVKQFDVPFGLHTRLTAIKYVIFMVIFGVSLYDLGMAEKLAEVEPFKTAIILKFMRDWWFVLFAVSLLVVGLFIERFFCRYLCPLGAAMAIPAKLQIFTWLRRYQMCGNPCQLCKQECPVQAIHPEGFINLNECVQCLHCQVLYNHTTRCPQVVATNKKKAKQAAAKAELEAQRAAETKPQEQVVHFVKNVGKAPTGKEKE